MSRREKRVGIIQSQINSTENLPYYLFKNYFKIISHDTPQSSQGQLSFSFSHKNSLFRCATVPIYLTFLNSSSRIIN
jgi:hypothetical protein